MRCIVFSLLLVCGLLADASAFTLQSSAKVNIVPATQIQLVPDSRTSLDGPAATTAWRSGLPGQITFSVSGPPDLWAKVTLVDLDEEILPPEISSQAGPAHQLELTFPLVGTCRAPVKPYRSLLLRVEYE